MVLNQRGNRGIADHWRAELAEAVAATRAVLDQFKRYGSGQQAQGAVQRQIEPARELRRGLRPLRQDAE